MQWLTYNLQKKSLILHPENKNPMLLADNPLIWLWRFRKRKGYGVHSPFAFRLITEVLTEHEAYYAYSQLDAQLKWYQQWRYRRFVHLLLRLANCQQPKKVAAIGLPFVEVEALKAGCQKAEVVHLQSGDVMANLPMKSDFIVADAGYAALLSDSVNDGGLLVLKDIHRFRDVWQNVKKNDTFTATFDLYDVGLAFRQQKLNKQSYIVNW